MDRVRTVSTMSSPSIDHPLSTDRFNSLIAPVRRQTRAAGFWGAIALPFLYLPLLAMGVDSVTEATVILALLGLNLLAVLVGRGHNLD